MSLDPRLKTLLDIVEIVGPFLGPIGGTVAAAAEVIEAGAPAVEKVWNETAKPLMTIAMAAVHKRMVDHGETMDEARVHVAVALGAIGGWTREETERAFALQGSASS